VQKTEQIVLFVVTSRRKTTSVQKTRTVASHLLVPLALQRGIAGGDDHH